MKDNNGKERVGVYICHCGTNISHTVDVEAVAEYARTLPGVVKVREYKYMCSDPGQDLIKKDVTEDNLTRVVVSSCSPLMHEETFRNTCEDAGLNRFLFQMSNIREQCSWVHSDRTKATAKAKRLIAAAARRVQHHMSMEQREAPVHPDTLIVGAGIAGIEAALKIAESGKKVYLVEKEPSIGGHMAKFDKTFPTLDCAAYILTPKMVQVGQHPNIELLTYSEVEEVSGYVGNFKAKIRRKARYVDENKCTGCGDCMKNCPVRNIAHFEEVDGLGKVELPEEDRQTLKQTLADHEANQAAIISVLQDINAHYRYLPENVLRHVARSLNVPLSHVYSIATFYNAFSLVPRGKYVVRVCMGTACHVKGGHRILQALERMLGIDKGGTTEDKKFSLEEVRCLGCCGLAPVITMNEDLYGSVTQAKRPKILDRYKKEEPVTAEAGFGGTMDG
jgi:NADH:ubiquinone oxidoreductase subunit E